MCDHIHCTCYTVHECLHFYSLRFTEMTEMFWRSKKICHSFFSSPTVAGIHGGEEGCYSLALSGGYEDDLDYGDCFTYTGEG